MQQEVFNRFREIIHRESGISLSDEKRLLLQNRILKRLRALKLSCEAEYLRIVELDTEGSELVNLIDAISTNHTYFFREETHFELLQTLLAKRSDQKAIKIWCAAASSGEEPYSLAITAIESLGDRHKRCKIMASDICTTVLNQALQGIYAPNQLRDVPPAQQQRYFNTVRIADELRFQVKPFLMEKVLFKKLNLARFPYPLHGPLDIIFCRNVMIYFDSELREKLARSFYNLLRPGGYLFIGHSESLSGLEHQFSTVQSAVYRKEIG